MKGRRQMIKSTAIELKRLEMLTDTSVQLSLVLINNKVLFAQVDNKRQEIRDRGKDIRQ